MAAEEQSPNPDNLCHAVSLRVVRAGNLKDHGDLFEALTTAKQAKH